MKKKVLTVDDSRTIRNMLLVTLNNAGFETINEVALDHVWTATRFTQKAITAKPARKAVKRTELDLV